MKESLSHRAALLAAAVLSGAAMIVHAADSLASQHSLLKAYAGEYIPQVVVIDSNGKVLASNFVNNVYAEPDKTLEDLSKILSSGAAK